MPDPKDNAKASGDIHPPETEDLSRQRPRAQPGTEDTEGGTARGDLEDEGRPGKGENQAGYLKDKDGQGGRNT